MMRFDLCDPQPVANVLHPISIHVILSAIYFILYGRSNPGSTLTCVEIRFKDFGTLIEVSDNGIGINDENFALIGAYLLD